MNDESRSRFEQSATYPWLELRTARDVLEREPGSLEVPENSDLLLSPYEREQSEYFMHVMLRSYEDVQLLGFVPRNLSEEKVRRAIAMDDEEARKLADKMMDTAERRGCGCKDEQLQASRSYGSDLRRLYTSTRKGYHPALAQLLSEHLSARVEADSPFPGIIRKWATLNNTSLISAIFQDITINRGATLSVDANTTSLLAGTIWIHRTGRLVSQGNYLKIWAHALSSFSATFAQQATAVHLYPWRGQN